MSLMLLALVATLQEKAAAPVSIDRFEISTEAQLPAESEARALAADAERAEWKVARARFDLPAEPVEGRWALMVGVGGASLEATLNGTPIQAARDAEAERLDLAAPPVFNLSSDLLRAGTNVLELQLVAGGSDFLRGTGLLLPPGPAEALRATLATPIEDRVARAFGASGSRGAGACLNPRVALRERGELRLHAVLAQTIETESGVLACTDLSRRGESRFPTASVSGRHADEATLDFVHAAYAPLSRERPQLAERPWLFGEWGFRRSRRAGDFNYSMTVHVFPTLGGALRRAEVSSGLLLHNDRMAFWVEDGRVIGDDEHALGVQLEFSTQGAGGQTMSGPRIGYLVLRYDSAEDAEQLEGLLKRRNGIESQVRQFAGAFSSLSMPKELDLGTPDIRLWERSFQEIGTTSEGWALDHGRVGGARSYWSGSWPAWLYPAMEGALVSEQGQAWAAATPDDRRGVLAGLYTVLRAARVMQLSAAHGLFQDGEVDRLLDILATSLAALERGLPRADADDPALCHLWCACLAAHQQLGEQLLAVGHDAGERTRAQAGELRTSLFAATDEGGHWSGSTLDLGEACSLFEESAALALSAEADEQGTAWARSLDERLPAPERPSLTELLLIRSLAQVGSVAAMNARLSTLSDRVGEVQDLDDGVAGAMMDLRYFGFGGLKISAGRSIEIAPRVHYKSGFTSNLRFGETQIKVNVGPPDVQFFRLMNLHNQSEHELKLTLGVPGNLGRGRRTEIGEQKLSYYEFTLAPGEQRSQRIR